MIEISKLNLSEEDNIIKFTFKNNEIEMLKYLPIKKKYDVIMITLQKSFDEDGNYYNPIKLDKYFHLHMFKSYVKNISYDVEMSEDELYDALETCGLMKAFLQNINTEEYNRLYDYLHETAEADGSYRQSALGFIRDSITRLPLKTETVMNLINNFDKDKLADLMRVAQNLEGGKPFQQAE